MRLYRLHLARYGKFTNFGIDFGAVPADGYDLHIVFGPNEAGKTTILSAFLDLLFGIERQSRFNFLHPYPTMRIDASLEQDGIIQDIVRVRGPQNSLLDGNEQPVSERLIGARLGGIDRDSYRAMFSLDDDTIEKGGESILASKGDLGQLLFSASAGLSDLSKTLSALRSESERFYKSSRSGELADFKSSIADLKAKRDAIDTLAPAYTRLGEARDRAAALYQAALAERAAMRSRMDEIGRSLAALPRLAALRSLRTQLEPLAMLPEAPAGWPEAFPALQAEQIRIAAELETACAEVLARQTELAATEVDDTALQLGSRVDGWSLARGRAETAEQDIPERRREVGDQAREIARILTRMGHAEETDPGRLVLDAATVAELRALIEARSGIATARASALDELSEARHRLQTALEKLQQAAPAATDLSALAAAVTLDDHPARRRIAQRARADSLDALTERLRDLRPWEGNAGQLAAMSVPDETEKAALAAAEKLAEQHEKDLARLTSEQLRLTAQRGAIASVAGVVSDGEAAEIRAARDRAWTSHRQTLDIASADMFEAALRRDDIVTNARLRHEKDIARLQQIDENLAEVTVQCTHTTQLLVRAQESLRQIRAAMPPGITSLAQLEAWLRKRDRALESRARLKQAEADLREADQDAAAARDRLLRALTSAGIAHDATAETAVLLMTAQAALDRDAIMRGLRGEVERHQADVTNRERALAKAVRDDEAWTAAWAEACSSCWLRDLGAAPKVTVVREILQASAELGPALDRRDTLLGRIADMQRDQQAFADEVEPVAASMGRSPGNALDLARQIAAQVQAARQAHDLRAERALALDKALARQGELNDRRARHEQRSADITAHFGVASLAEAGIKLQQIARKAELQIQSATIEREIRDALQVQSIADAETLLDSADRAALETELRDLTSRFEQTDHRVRELYMEHRQAEDRIAAVDGDGAVAKIEEQRRTILLQIEDGALTYLKRRIGITAAEHALRLYRRRHQSSMMAQASNAFRTITRGAYTGLTAQPDGNKEILVALAADGSSREADKLSKGTRFQLYLALRVAGYHEFARQRQPVPFIADDIMETFDDFRAEEAIRLFAGMARVGQVIYLTHHHHLCEIAQKVCPGVRLHDLSAAA